MLTEYVERAMSKAMYNKLEDGIYCGKIPECHGTIAFDETLYQCQIELRAVLESWLDCTRIPEAAEIKEGGDGVYHHHL